MPPDKSELLKISFSYFSTKTYVVGAQKNRLNETVILSNPKHMFELTDKKKNILTLFFCVSGPM